MRNIVVSVVAAEAVVGVEINGAILEKHVLLVLLIAEPVLHLHPGVAMDPATTANPVVAVQVIAAFAPVQPLCNPAIIVYWGNPTKNMNVVL